MGNFEQKKGILVDLHINFNISGRKNQPKDETVPMASFFTEGCLSFGGFLYIVI